MQAFFESTGGKFAVIAVIALLLLFITLSGKNKKADVRALTVSALMIALATVLGEIKLFSMPQGGSVTLLSILPIVVCGYLLGTRRGVMAGFCVGLINLIFGPYVIHPVQLLLDYPIAFGALGLSGIVRDKSNGLTKGYIIGILGRYICAVMSGVIFFGEYAPEGFNAWTWSLWYNLTYLAVEGIITVIIINIPAVKSMFLRFKAQLAN
ncbi:MAG: energy-coupled thiamine transporter ThiT [Mogibacterium sp.]|nr:energy-coupled thiamine transporter ThiT [Mogibacterium sp.]MBR2540501.1 energy-coupled thiamine transporter ThiT [Mogibacterium sp.]